MSRFIGERIVPKPCGVWDRDKGYEMLCVVYDPDSGDSYISRKEVPAGTNLSDADYWMLCSRFTAQIAQFASQVETAERKLDAGLLSMEKGTALLEARMDAVMAGDGDGVDYAAEIMDARFGLDSLVYGCLGAAVREQFRQVYRDLGYALVPYAGAVDRSGDTTVAFSGKHYYAANNDTYDVDLYITKVFLISACDVDGAEVKLLALDGAGVIQENFGTFTASGKAGEAIAIEPGIPLHLKPGRRLLLYRARSLSMDGLVLRYGTVAPPARTGFVTCTAPKEYGVGDAPVFGNFTGNAAVWVEAYCGKLPFGSDADVEALLSEVGDARRDSLGHTFDTLGDSIRAGQEHLFREFTVDVGAEGASLTGTRSATALYGNATPLPEGTVKSVTAYCYPKGEGEQELYAAVFSPESKTLTDATLLSYTPSAADEAETVTFQTGLMCHEGDLLFLGLSPTGTAYGYGSMEGGTVYVLSSPSGGVAAGAKATVSQTMEGIHMGIRAEVTAQGTVKEWVGELETQQEALSAEAADARTDVNGTVYGSVGEAIRAISGQAYVKKMVTVGGDTFRLGNAKSSVGSLYGNDTPLPEGILRSISIFCYPASLDEQGIRAVVVNRDTRIVTDAALLTYMPGTADGPEEVTFETSLVCHEGDRLLLGSSPTEMPYGYTTSVEGGAVIGVSSTTSREWAAGDKASFFSLSNIRMDIKARVECTVGVAGCVEEMLVEIGALSEENARLSAEKDALEAEVQAIGSKDPLYGKILSVTGDSEAAGHSVGTANSYGGLIAARNGMTLHMYAINGRKLCTGNATSLCDTYTEIAEDSDYILVQIGYNDSFVASVDDDSTDTTTYKGAFNMLIEGLLDHYPNARIGILVPYYFDGNAAKEARAQWMMERCRHYHVQCYDGCVNSGLAYGRESQAGYFIDAVHLSKAGHDRISWLYEDFLRRC